MKKIISWLTAISIIIFVIAWAMIGLKIFNGDYDITLGTYIALFSIIVFFVCLLYLKVTNRCPYCGKMKHNFGKYCPYCGKEIN